VNLVSYCYSGICAGTNIKAEDINLRMNNEKSPYRLGSLSSVLSVEGRLFKNPF
jgi:hypothetical protein